MNLATGTLVVGAAETDAGTDREVDLPAGLIEALSEWRTERRVCGPGDPVLSEQGIEPISERVTPHLLRRTYASVRAAAGDHPVHIADQLEHEDPGLTFRVTSGPRDAGIDSARAAAQPSIGH